MLNVRELQIALRDLGYNPGPIDGINGPLTRQAVQKFQHANGLIPDGIYGPATHRALTALLGAAQSRAIGGLEPPWMAWARSKVGVHERRDGAKVLGWLKRFASWVTDASTSWCGAFVGMAITSTLPNEPIPSNPLGARQWLKFGKHLPYPAVGCLVVFWRISPSAWQGHVGFLAGRDARGNLMILGGNQSDMVSIVPFAETRLLGYRWPSGYPMPDRAPLPLLHSDGRVSTNEQ